jgi:NADPH:quinone reductase-like Zn-dependent oxidoreductase
MRAAVNTRYGSPDVVEVRDIAKPAPKPNEVLVAVHATTVNRSDCGFLRAHPFPMRAFTGLMAPKRHVLGMDFAGVVEAVGADVTRFRPGQRVFGVMSWGLLGAHAEYLCSPERGYIAELPANVSFEQGVVGEGAIYAHACLRSLGLKQGRKIMIYGASGAIGVAAVQLARALGAEVTAVVATRHVDMARAIGANAVIDYKTEDFTKGEPVFDCIMDAVGKASYTRCRKLLKPGAPFIATDMGPGGQTLRLALWSALTGDRRVLIAAPRRDEGFIDYLRDLMERGAFRAVIDRRYPLAAIVEAYKYVEQGQKTGIVVIDVR